MYEYPFHSESIHTYIHILMAPTKVMQEKKYILWDHYTEAGWKSIILTGAGILYTSNKNHSGLGEKW